jgi:drug/metabolite transporter (DMT)-like permease
VSSPLAAGLGLALASALALDIGFLIQQRAVASAPALSLHTPGASARSLIAGWRWPAGFFLGLAGWVLYFVALTLAPLSLVQTVTAAGIGLLVVLAAVGSRTMPPRRERLGALLATVGLMALAAGAGYSGARDSAPPAWSLAILAAGVLVVVAFALRRRSAALGGLAAGLCYGAGDITSKSLLIALPHHPAAAAVLASPLLYVTAGAHGLGFLLIQRAFRHGGPITSLGPMTGALNLLPMAAGVLLLGERMPSSGVGLALRLCAFSAAVAGAWALAGRGVPARTDESPAEPMCWAPATLPGAAR